MGLDGCKAGWLGASAGDDGVGFTVLSRFEEALATAEVVAVDIPIGLPEEGARECDLAARRLLPGRGSSVFPAPVRAVLAAETYAQARDLSVAAHGKSLSAQAFGIVPKIAEVDGVRDPARVVEVHPEVSFARLAGEVLPPKRTVDGALARLAVLEPVFGPVPRTAPRGAAFDDCLDALVCLWTGRRWLAGEAEVLGGDLDATGQVMRIVV